MEQTMHVPDFRHDVARARAHDRLRESLEMIENHQPSPPHSSLNWHALVLARSGNLLISLGRRLCRMAGTVPPRAGQTSVSLDKGMA